MVTDSSPAPHQAAAPPGTVRIAGALVTLEGVVAVGIAIVLVIRGLLGADESLANGFGTALWFILLGGAVLAAGIGLLLGKRWGRGIAVVAQVLLLPVVWALLTASHQPFFGALLGAVVVVALVSLFTRPSLLWAQGE